MQAAGLLDRLRTVAGFGDELEIIVRVEDRSQGGARERVVVGDQHAPAHGPPGSSGIPARTRYPLSAPGSHDVQQS